MKQRVHAIWERLRASYWFLPALMILLAAGLSWGCLALDERIRGSVMREQGWIYSGGPQGARAVLATIAGSIITVAATTFSITIAVLSMASAQFGPRLLRNFMRDRANQTVLGMFVATFLYTLLVLRTVRGTDQDTFVPHLSVTVGVVLAVVCLAALIFFIHHTAESIQISHLIDQVGRELEDAVRRLFPEAPGKPEAAPTVPKESGQLILAQTGGYLQAIDLDDLLDVAASRRIVVRLEKHPGDFIIEGMALAEVWGPALQPEDDAVRNAFTMGRQRSPDQDPEFGFLQLVEVAVRALSPGINDPFTAIMCIDRIASAMCLLADRFLPTAQGIDHEGIVRVIAQPYRYDRLVHSAFSLIRQNGESHAIIVDALRRHIDLISARARNTELRLSLDHERAMLPGELDTRVQPS